MSEPMDLTVWHTFAQAVGTMGPVGVTGLAGWYIYLRFRGNGNGHVQAAVDEATMQHDMLKSLERLEEHERNEDQFLQSLVIAQQRIADILERLERRMEHRA